MDNSMEMTSSTVVYRCHMKICGLQMEAFLLQMTFVQLVKMKIFIMVTTNCSFYVTLKFTEQLNISTFY